MNEAKIVVVVFLASWISVTYFFSNWLRIISLLVFVVLVPYLYIVDVSVVERFLSNLKRKNPSYQTTRISKCTIHYTIDENRTTELKTNRTIVIIPDPPMTIEHYTKSHITDDLKVGNSAVIVMEAPGFGFSTPHGNFSYSWEDYAECVEDFLKQMNRAPYVLITPCVLGLAGLQVAERMAKDVTHLVLEQCPSYKDACSWAKLMDMSGFISTKVVGQLFLFLQSKMVAKKWCSRAIVDKTYKHVIMQNTMDSQDRGALFSLATCFQKLFYTRKTAPSFGPIVQPTLLLWGCSDRSHKKTERKGVLRYISSQVEYKEFPDIGHFPDLEQPGIFVRHVRDFLEKDQ